jgi:hypothetical protein
MSIADYLLGLISVITETALIYIVNSHRTVVTVNIGKSEGLYSSTTKRLSKQNSGLLEVGLVEVDIPQHPVVLHGMVARSSKRLSTTLQEFIRLPSSLKHRFNFPYHLYIIYMKFHSNFHSMGKN